MSSQVLQHHWDANTAAFGLGTLIRQGVNNRENLEFPFFIVVVFVSFFVLRADVHPPHWKQILFWRQTDKSRPFSFYFSEILNIILESNDGSLDYITKLSTSPSSTSFNYAISSIWPAGHPQCNPNGSNEIVENLQNMFPCFRMVSIRLLTLA